MQLAAIAVLGAFCALTLRRQVPELSLVLTVVTGLLLLAAVLKGLDQVRAMLEELAALAGLSPEVLLPLVKTVGIAILTRVTAEVCREAGASGIASVAEITGAAAALCVALPLVQGVMAMVAGLL